MHLSTVSEWLNWISSVHMSDIELGLDRVKEVAARLALLSPGPPVIIVGGTNGKGSCVAALAAIYRAAHYHVGTFTSPILFKHNEQVTLDGIAASDAAFCQAFAKIELKRGNISLTPFEYHTLAALLIFQSYALDLLILEVGLGGRLDAVNIMDADVAIVTSIGIDHVEWLGTTRAAIAFEKAGIFRSNKPSICGDRVPPASLLAYAKKINTPLFIQGKHFHYQTNHHHWLWMHDTIRLDQLPLNALATQNMSTVLMAVHLLQKQLPIKREALDQGLSQVNLPARVQVIHGAINKIFDVAHNPDAVAYLSEQLNAIPCHGKTHAVFSMLADKDITESIKKIRNGIDHWYIAPLAVKRAAAKEALLQAFQQLNLNEVTLFLTVEEAYQVAQSKAERGDRIVVFGSFHTVAKVLNVGN